MNSERIRKAQASKKASSVGDEEELASLLLDKALAEYQVIARATTARSEEFWEKQARSIYTHLRQEAPVPFVRRIAPLSVALALVVSIGLVLFFRHQRPVAPDFAAEADQQLLLDVEQALQRRAPAPLEPATLISAEILPSVRILAEP